MIKQCPKLRDVIYGLPLELIEYGEIKVGRNGQNRKCWKKTLVAVHRRFNWEPSSKKKNFFASGHERTNKGDSSGSTPIPPFVFEVKMGNLFKTF